MARQYRNGKCSCWDRVNRELAKDDSRLELAFTFSGHNYLKVSTYRTDGNKRKQPKSVLVSFCPFCGAKLKDAE